MKHARRNRALALALTLALLAGLLPTAALALDPVPPTGGEIAAFSPLPGGTEERAVPFGTPREALDLPGAVTAQVCRVTAEEGDGEASALREEDVFLDWGDGEPAYDAQTPGAYVFTAGAQGFTLAAGLSWPEITVTVEAPVCGCAAACPDGAMDTACPVCGAEGAKPEDCGKYEPPVGLSLPRNGGVTVGDFVVSGDNLTQGDKNNPEDFYLDNNVLHIASGKEMTITMRTSVEATTEYRLAVVKNGDTPTTANVTVDGVKVNMGGTGSSDGPGFAAWDVNDGCTLNLTLADGSENSFISGLDYPGIQVLEGAAIVINGDTGALAAQGGGGGAGIGGSAESYKTHSGSITINGGTVTATGGNQAAGIGGGLYGDGDTVIINGGTVDATGGVVAAGIGGGGQGDGGIIIITGGNITAKATQDSNLYGGAGIGGGAASKSGTITITGGTITATGGRLAAGIGGGGISDGGSITITDGDVTANGQGDASSVGAGAGEDKGAPVDTYIRTVALNANSTGTEGTATNSLLRGADGNFTVTGAITLPVNLTVMANKTLTVGEGAKLIVPEHATLTNNGTINGNGTLEGAGTFTRGERGAYTLKVTRSIPAPTVLSASATSVTLGAVVPSMGRGDGAVTYLASKQSTKPQPGSGWSSDLTFNGLHPETPYYIFARVSDGAIYQDVVSPGTAFTTQKEGDFQAGDFVVSGTNLTQGSKDHPQDFYLDNSVLHIASGKKMTITMRQGVSETTAWRLAVVKNGETPTTANVTINGVKVDMGFGTAWDVNSGCTLNLTLADGSQNSFTVSNNQAGIKVQTGAAIVIDGTGTLTARGEFGAGIGGSPYGSAGSVTIRSGTINATGSHGSAGIGGGSNGGTGGSVTVHGGTVNAEGGGYAAGIGGDGAAVTIHGGTVTATGGSAAGTDSVDGPGIGGSSGGSPGTLTVSPAAGWETAVKAGAHAAAAQPVGGSPFREKAGGHNITDAVKDSRYFHSKTAPIEQFPALTPGGTYWFDLSGAGIPGTVNTGYDGGDHPDRAYPSLPDSTLHYVPFTYAGTINAYVLKSDSGGVTNASAAAAQTTESTAQYGHTYDHSLFVADYNVTNNVNWNELNAQGMMFGKSYASGGVDYTLRVPSVGSSATTGLDANERGTPGNNEWDAILDKAGQDWQDNDAGYIKSWNGIVSWGQDTNTLGVSVRAGRGYYSARSYYYFLSGSRRPDIGFRPVLELPSASSSASLNTLALDLNGGRLATTAGYAGDPVTALQFVYIDDTFTAPGAEDFTRPAGRPGTYLQWRGSDGRDYAPGAAVPAAVTALTAVWAAPTSPGTGGGWSGGPDTGDGGSRVTVTAPAPTPEDPNPPTEGVIAPPARVDGDGTLKVDVSDRDIQNAIDQALRQAKRDGAQDNGIAVSIDLSGLRTEFNALPLTLSKAAYAKLVEAGVRYLTVKTPQISLSLDLETLKTIHAAATGDVTIDAVKADAAALPEAARTALGGRPAYDLTVMSGGRAISSFGGLITVTLPYALRAGERGDGLQMAYVGADGALRFLADSSYDAHAKALIGRTDHFTLFGIGDRPAPAFTDIAGHWAEEDIRRVAALGLLGGTGGGAFSPGADMTRGMLVTALHRLAGLPQAGGEGCAFTDVAPGAYYAGAVDWACGAGIARGTGPAAFSPDRPVTRQELAVLLYHCAAALDHALPAGGEAAPFADGDAVAPWAADAVRAMRMAGILNGKQGNRFDPAGAATRAEVAAVLRRFAEGAAAPRIPPG